MARRSGRIVLGLTGLLGLAVVTLACTSPPPQAGNSSPTTGTNSSPALAGAPDYAAAAARTLAGVSGQQEGIWVTGVGHATLAPDVAVLSLGVEAQEPTVSSAREKAATAMQAVINALKAAGVADKDIQTQHFSIQPVYHYEEVTSRQTGARSSKQVLDGYRVSNQVVAKARDLARVGAVIDNAVAAGGDLTRINSITLTAEDPSKAQAEARTKAMQEAVAHARQLAQAAGVTLGKPVSISESGGEAPQPRAYLEGRAFAAAAEAPTPIQAGELEVTVTVQAVFTIP